MATITRATVETQSPWGKTGRTAIVRSSRRLRGTAVALLAGLVCAWAPAPASAQTTVDTPEALTIGGRFGLSGYEIPFTPGDEKDVRAQWYTGVRLSLDIAKVSEDGGRRQVIVTANVSTWGVRLFAPTVIEVTVGKSGDSAVSGTDYRAVPKFNITIPKARQGGHTSFYLEPLGDAEWEGAEQITIHGRHVTDHTPDPVAGTTLTVTDEGDSPYTGSQVFLSVNPSKVSEADSATTVEVTARSDAQSVSRRVMVTLSDGVATATWGVDYQIVHNFDITLPANAVSATGTFTLTPIQDTLAEGDETINITGQVDGHDSGVTGTTLTLTDDDAPPAVTLSASPSSVTENGGAKTVTVTATSAAAASSARTVLVAVGNPVKDTATPGTDYAVVPNFTITIAANATTGTGSFVLTPTNDTTAENAESISIGGAPESAGAAFTVGGTAMTLTDDDALPAVTLSAAPSSVSEGADPTTVTVTATAASAVAWARKVRVTLGTGASTATMGVDYKLVQNFDITIAANATSGTGTFTLTPIQDTTNEGNETIAVSGQSPRTTVTGTTVTLADDDIHPPITLSVSPSSVSEGAGATTVTVTATLTTARALALGIIATVGGSGDSAVSGTDYSVNPSQFFINVAAGQTSATGTFTLTPTQDTAVEGGETISVSGVTSGTTVTGTTVTIADDDSYPAVTLSVNPTSVSEGASATSVTVTATSTSSVASSRTVTVSVGQTGTATSNTDYADVSDFTVTIAANKTSGTGTFTLTPKPDTLVEGDETIGVSGSSPSTTVTGTTLTLTDANPKVTLSASPTSVSEGASATSVTVTATANVADTVARTVTVSVGKTGSATSGTDYKAVSDFTITIAANKTSGTGTFTLTPTQDTAVEGSETIGVSGTGERLKVTGTTVTLADDDQHPTVALSAAPASVGENASATSVTVTATSESAISSARTVTVSVGGSGTATSGTDYAAVSDFTITIAANKTSGTGTFTLTPTQDTAVEGSETIGVAGTSPSTTVTGATLTLTDDDRPTVTLSVNPSSVGEGASATTVTVTATANTTHTSHRSVSVAVGGSADSATEGVDYAAVSDFDITIEAYESSATATFTLTPTQDTIVEGNETISVSGDGHGLRVNHASLTLTDDERRYADISMSTNVSSWSEGGGAKTVRVTLNVSGDNSTSRPVTISVGQSGDGATEGVDYETVADFDVTIPAYQGSASGTFTLTPVQDSLIEGTEKITIVGTPAYSGWSVNSRHLDLTDDDTYAVTLSANPSSVNEGAGATSVTVTATDAYAYSARRTLTVSVGGSGTAVAGGDYTGVSDFTVTIPANQLSGSGTFTLTPIDDGANEADETIGVSGVGASITVTGTDITLTDNDEPFLGFDAASAKEGDSGTTTLTVTARLTDANGKAESSEDTVTGNWKASSEQGDTATSGTDYTAATGLLTFSPGETSKTFDISVTGDTAIEADETFTLRWTDWSNALLAHYTRTATIEDDDTPAVTLSVSPSSVGEGAGATQVTVTAATASAGASARTVTVSVGGTGTATSGTDYAAVTDFTVTIPANATSGTGTFSLTPTQDTAVEGSETIGVSGIGTGVTVTGTTVTLTDDDTYPAVTLTAAPSSVGEQAPGTAVTVTATSTSAVSLARTVTISVGGSGTATSGTDYAAVSDFTVTIPANATSGAGTFTLAPTDDTALEGDETIGVSGTSPGTTVTGTTLTLADDDRPTIALATVPANLKVAEDAVRSSVTVRATAAGPMKAKTTVTLTVGASGDGAAKGTDYKVSNVGTITIPKDQAAGEASFELAPVQDTLVESDETISVSGASSGGNTVTGTSLTLTDDDSYPAVTLSAAPSSVGEGASATSVTVTATAVSAMSSARTVTVSVGDTGTATSGTDYAAVSDFTVTIAANAKTGTGTFTLTPTQDTTVEGSETIGVAGTSTQSTVTGTTVTLTDDDSYPAITLSANPSSVSEGAIGTATLVTVTASSSAMSSARTVTVSVGGSGTATRGTDYATVADFTVTIAANATSGTGTFNLTPTQDTAVEGSETVGVAGASPSSTVTGTTVTLTDDDTHAIDLSASPSTVAEDKTSETITVTATINAARTAATTVTVSVGDSGDQAKSGTDYKAVSDFTVTIAANKTSGTGTFTFEPKTDTAYEGLESVTISGTTSQSGGGGAAAFGASAANSANASTGIPVTDTSLSIHDASNYPSVTLSANPASVGEGASATSVTVTATATSAIASSREVTVSVGDSGTATSGTDYTAVTDFIIKIAANKKSGTGTFTLTPTQDNVVEGSETISVSATSLSTSVTGTTVTLTDDDRATVTVNDANANEGSDMTFTVTLNRAVVGGLTVTPGYTNVTASSSDYTANTTGISFSGNANETQTFTVSTTQDTVVEDSETFTVGLSVSGTTLTGSITSTDTGTGTINAGTGNNLDTATLTINDASASEGDGISFTVTLSEAVQGGLTVTPSYNGINDTAVEGTDYDENTEALSFTGTKGETKTFTVSTDEDTVLEGDETFTVGLTVSGTTLSDNITSNDTGTGTINNDDSTAVTVNDASAEEGDDVTFTVTLSEAVQGGLTVTPGYTNGTAASTDYTANTTALSFTGTKGETKTFTVDTTADAVLEADETFTVGLTVSKAPTGVTATDTGTGTINDDDSAAVTINDASADEGDDMTFTVTLSEAVQGGLTVTPGYTNGTAASTDYTANTTALTFTGTKGETKTFTVATTEDTVLEGNETFTVSLAVSDTPTGTTVTATDTGTGTVNNDDGATVTINDASASEGDDITFTVSLGTAVAGGLTVTPGYTNGTAASGDYTANTTALTFTGTANETKTFTVSTTEDAVVEANETFTVGLSVSGTSLSVTASDTGTGTINNDDGTAVTVNDADADEGDGMTFTVTLSEAVQGGLTVTPSYNGINDTAVEGTDYDENTEALSFTGTKGETKTFTVSTDEDTVLEGDETFTVGLSVSGTSLSVTATDTGTGTINNDDSAAVTVNDADADEGDGMTFTVTLSEAVQGGLTVTPSYNGINDTAVEGTDYDENTEALSFTGTKDETKTFTVSTTQDAVLEVDETFTVGLSSSNLSVTATDTGTGTINNDDAATVTISTESVEEGGTLTFTVTLNNAVAGGFTATPDYTAGGTAGSEDYTANTAALSFSGTANETKTFTVLTTKDTVVEGDEVFKVAPKISKLSEGVHEVTGAAGQGTITDDDTTEITLTASPSSVAEDVATAPTVTVTASTDGDTFPEDQTVTVSVGVGDDETIDYATPGTDYAAVTDFDLTISAGQTSGTATFTLTPTDDNLIEPAETLMVAGSATGLTVTAAMLTLTDDDQEVISQPLVLPPITLSASPASVSEGAPGTKVTVTATVGDGTVAFADAKTVTLTVGAGGDSATEGTDYAKVTDTITFTIAAGEKTGTGTFTLTPTNDDVIELDEALTVAGTSGDLKVADTRVTLADDDTATLTVSDSTGLEGEALAFALTLSQPVPEAVTLSYTTQDGTATVADEDYVPATTGSLTLSPRTTTGTLTVPTTADPMVEPDETFTVTVSAAGSRVEVSEPVATGTIQNDDVAHVQVSNIEGIEGETLTFTVTLSAPVYTDVVLAYTTQDGTATVADDDYVPATTGSRLTVPARTTTEQTAVQTIADGLLEDDETFTVQLRLTADTVAGVVLGPAPTAPVTAGTVQAAGHTPDHVDGTGTILNNDEAVRERLKRVQTPILADLSLAMTDSVVRAVTARLAQAATQRCARGITVPGPPADPDADLPRSNGPLPDTTPSLRDVLAGSSFVFSLSGGESTKGTDPTKDPDPAEGAATPACGENQRPLTLWGQGDLRALSGQQRNGLGEAVGWDGNVVGGLLGLDLPIGATGLAGLGVSHFQSAFDYQYTTPRGKTVPGTYETTMTSLHPYAKWAPWAETSLWLTGGYGRGEVTMAEDKLGEQTADSWWATLAAGGLVRLSPDVALLPGGATTVDLKTEAWLTRFQVEDNADFLKDLSVHTHRLRLAVVGEHTWELESGGVLTPLLEFGVRRDGGDGVTGLGVEVGGRVGYVDPSGRFTVEGRGHVLTAHEGGKDEWGAGGVIRLAPRADGHGLWFSVVPSYGDVTSGAERLWEQGVTRPAGAAAAPMARVEAQLGYGVPARAGRGVVTPYGGLVFSGAGEQLYAVGTRLALRSGLVCSLEGTRGTNGAGAPENYGVLLRLDFSW